MHVERHLGKFRVSFLEADLKRQVRPHWITDSSDRLLEMFVRGAEFRTLEDRQAFEYAIQKGRGVTCLRLTAEQYSKLRS